MTHTHIYIHMYICVCIYINILYNIYIYKAYIHIYIYNIHTHTQRYIRKILTKDSRQKKNTTNTKKKYIYMYKIGKYHERLC